QEVGRASAGINIIEIDGAVRRRDSQRNKRPLIRQRVQSGMEVYGGRIVGAPNITEFGHAAAVDVATKTEAGFVTTIDPHENAVEGGFSGRIDPSRKGRGIRVQVYR